MFYPSRAFILGRFRWVGIYIALQPESKPVHASLLRLESLHGFLMDVGPMREIDQIDRFVLHAERCIQFPLLQHRRWVDRFNADRRLHLIEMEIRSLFDPLLQSVSKWTCLSYL